LNYSKNIPMQVYDDGPAKITTDGEMTEESEFGHGFGQNKGSFGGMIRPQRALFADSAEIEDFE
jgi:hypothetical protein